MVLQNMLNSLLLVSGIIFPALLVLVYALAMLLVGWIVAKVLQWVVALVLKTVMLDKGCQAIGLTPILTKGEIKKAPSDLLGDLVYWLLIFITIVATADFLGLRGATMMFAGVLSYLPVVLTAVIVLAATMFLASLTSAVVLLLANNIGLSNSKPLMRVVYYSLIIFGVIVALGILGIPANYIMKESSLVVGMVALAAAIAFGLGCKDVAGDFITNLFKSR